MTAPAKSAADLLRDELAALNAAYQAELAQKAIDTGRWQDRLSAIQEGRQAWMIEVMTADGPRWWTGEGTTHLAFSKQPNDAVRFCRQQDAELVRCRLFKDALYTLSRSTEHVWLKS